MRMIPTSGLLPGEHRIKLTSGDCIRNPATSKHLIFGPGTAVLFIHPDHGISVKVLRPCAGCGQEVENPALYDQGSIYCASCVKGKV